jgi:hypothetical protein
MFEHINLDKIPVYTIFVLILIISANFLAQLFPCRLQKLLNNNIYIKHLFSFLTLLFFVVLTAPLDDKSLQNIFYKSLTLYVWFILIMRTDPYIFILLLLVIAFIYILVLKENELKADVENENKQKNSNQEKINKINQEITFIKNINQKLLYTSIILTIIGFLLYMGEKKCEYKKDFCYLTFIFGKPSCINKSPPINYKRAIECIFD